MSRIYNVEFKKKLVKLYIKKGYTLNNISEEYKVPIASISNWIKKYRTEYEKIINSSVNVI
ncbi:transposase [Clostridium tyrobutyricum]|uniref:helix-turn-helix domain-containing protein n=1 Tax=Clostridium tyrobutyricum TaxID=1519 RepID=UPI001C392636|nr:transposase [Clostridium tyrobutyricum]MBR9648899.1 transposase [Clostridium tyrobutyricum]MBV4417625.1 transposase [Clostridium tyrobutyricum]MBV4420635.1 transposase [Clostridium tyrobutyricum]